MNKLILLALAVSSSLLSGAEAKLYPLAVRLPLKGVPAAPGESVWPAPSDLTVDGPGVYALDKDKLKVEYESSLNGCEREIVEKLWQHYADVIFPPEPIEFAKPSSSSAQMNKLHFKLTGQTSTRANCKSDYYPVIEDTQAEAYEIKVQRDKTVISARAVWGLVRGLETFSQLVYSTDDNVPKIKQVSARDRPGFYYRSILIDTARHYMPIPMIKKHLNAMMYNKFNIFHWHMTDDQSFPFQTDAYPDLWKKGAFSPEHVYTKKDVLDIIEFARIRGIRVIPEFDTPGHTYSWGLSYPELISVCYGDGVPLKPIDGVHGAREILNPINEFTYEFMRNLLADVKSTFKDPYIHMGMDEVYYACWLSSPEIAEWMQKNNLTSIKQVEQHYCNRALDIAKKLNYKTIVWQDVWDNNVEVEKDTIIEIWKTIGQSSNFTWQQHMERSTREGHKTILSAPWYLNVIKYGSDWYDYYDIDILNFTGTAEQKELVIGGEACMWSEFVDGANSISRLWPRASSVGERLWSGSNREYDREEAKFRLDDQRCRMLRRGIEAAPIFNSMCGSYEPYMSKNVINHPLFNYPNTGHKAPTPLAALLGLVLLAIASIF